MVASVAEGSIGAEIGVQAGHFSRQILTLPIRQLLLIDPWRHQEGEYAKDIANVGQTLQDALFDAVESALGPNPRVRVHRLFSLDAAKIVSGLDWIYLDANHTRASVYADLKAWSKCLKPGGRIMGHDYTDRPEATAQGFGVIEAVDAFCAEEGWQITALTKEDWPSYMLEKV